MLNGYVRSLDIVNFLRENKIRNAKDLLVCDIICLNSLCKIVDEQLAKVDTSHIASKFKAEYKKIDSNIELAIRNRCDIFKRELPVFMELSSSFDEEAFVCFIFECHLQIYIDKVEHEIDNDLVQRAEKKLKVDLAICLPDCDVNKRNHFEKLLIDNDGIYKSLIQEIMRSRGTYIIQPMIRKLNDPKFNIDTLPEIDFIETALKTMAEQDDEVMNL